MIIEMGLSEWLYLIAGLIVCVLVGVVIGSKATAKELEEKYKRSVLVEEITECFEGCDFTKYNFTLPNGKDFVTTPEGYKTFYSVTTVRPFIDKIQVVINNHR